MQDRLRINWRINVPAILYLSTRDLGSLTWTSQYFGTNTSVFQTRAAQYFGTNTSVFQTRTAQFFGTSTLRNIAVITESTTAPTLLIVPGYPRNRYMVLLAVAYFRSAVLYKLRKPSRER